MASLTDYFANRDKDLPKAKFFIGDRIIGKWNKIPVVGSVLREENREVMIQSDLPVKFKNSYQTILTLKQTNVKLLKLEI